MFECFHGPHDYGTPDAHGRRHCRVCCHREDCAWIPDGRPMTCCVVIKGTTQGPTPLPKRRCVNCRTTKSACWVSGLASGRLKDGKRIFACSTRCADAYGTLLAGL